MVMWEAFGPGWKLVPSVNARGGWQVGYARGKRQKSGAYIATLAQVQRLRSWEKAKVTIVRVGPGRTPLDDDNLVGSAKHVRDGIALALGRDDGDTKAYKWIVKQEQGPAFGIRVTIEVTIP